MAFTKVIMQNPETQSLKEAPIGFSWTSLFFGGFVALFRGQFLAFFMWFTLGMVTGGLSNIVMAFTYNKSYLKSLIERGFKLKHSIVPVDLLTLKTNVKIPVL